MRNQTKTVLLAQAISFALFGNSVWAGGTTAGGGNVLPADQVEESALIRAVETSRPVIQAWLNGQHSSYQALRNHDGCTKPENRANCAIFSKIFDSQPTVFEVVDQTEVELKLNASCLDFEQKPNDGSMFGQKPGSVCISVSNIKQKLRADNYENQIAALILHEISHFKNTTEEEANTLQRSILEQLGYVPAKMSHTNLPIIQYKIHIINDITRVYSNHFFSSGDFSKTCVDWTDMNDDFSRLYSNNINTRSFEYSIPKYKALFWGAYVKSRAMQRYLCSQDPREPAEKRESNRLRYEDGFRGKDEITAPEYGDVMFESSPEVKVRKIVSRNLLLKEADELRTLVQEITDWYDGFIFSKFKSYQIR